MIDASDFSRHKVEMIMKVLVAIDGTECSWMAVDYVLHRPWHRNDEFKLLTVVEPMPTEFGIDNDDQDDYEANMLVSCNAITNKAAQKLKAKFPHHELSTEILYGTVAEQITEFAREWSADLIVIGTRGHTDCRRFLHGSVAEAVLHQAPCSVEVIKMREKSKTGASKSLDC